MEETKNEMNQEVPEETIVMNIILTRDGHVKLMGPLLADKTACYGILETAKDIVRDIHSPKIIKPSHNSGIMNFARGNGRH